MATPWLIFAVRDAFHALTPDMIAAMPIDWDNGSWKGPAQTFHRMRFHLDINRHGPDVGGIGSYTLATYPKPSAIAHNEIPRAGVPLHDGALLDGMNVRFCQTMPRSAAKGVGSCTQGAETGPPACLAITTDRRPGASLDKAICWPSNSRPSPGVFLTLGAWRAVLLRRGDNQ